MVTPGFSFHFWPFWPAVITFFSLLFLFDICIRALALWRAARANHTWWFIALLLLNTAGILPLLYLLFFAQEKLFTDNMPASKVSRSSSQARARQSKKKVSKK